MYEELNESVIDVSAYLERLHLERPEELDETGLDKLVFAHQCEIVFENLVPLSKRTVSLRTADLFEKIITNRRGGYCFELNGLFVKFLNALGYDAYSCRCRVIRGRNFIPAVTHRGNIVRLEDGLYYCDVGFGGPQPPFCLKVCDGFEKSGHGETFRVKKESEYWWSFFKKTGSGFEKIIMFSTVPEEDVDFDVLSYYCSTNPESVFTQQLFLNRRLENGSVSLTGNIYAKTTDGVRYEETIEDQNRIKEIAKAEFGLFL